MRKWLWLVAGLILGAVAGTGFAWSVRTTEFRGTDPSSLQPVYRGEYILLIGSAYESTGNLARARERLAEFPELNPDTLASLAQQVAVAQGPNDAARGLARLSVDLQTPTPAVALAAADTPVPVFTATREPTLLLSFQLIPSATVGPTLTGTPTPLPKFALVSNDPICDSGAGGSLLEITIRAPTSEGVPGVAIILVWPDGQGRFVTGMKPEIGPGYADYQIEPDTVYQVMLAGTAAARNLKAPECTGDGGTSYSGSIRLVIEMR